jgi:dihydrofolate reductase
MITLIAAIGRNNEIGFKNRLLWNIPEDMKHFKSYTMGKVVIMGSNTFLSIGSKPLPGRKCIVISSQDLHGCAAIPAKSVDAALSVDYCYPELVIIGGASIYEQTINRADKLVITHVDAEFEADTFFPRIDLTKWKINSTVEGHDANFNYKFVEYIRNEVSGDINGEASSV